MTARFTRLLSRPTLRPIFLLAIGGVIVVEIVAFSPSALEEGREKSAAIDPESLMENEAVTLASGIPKDRIPEYSIDQFQYVSTLGSEKQWKLVADKANLFNQERIVHTRRVQANLYDPDGKITVVTGKEAKYLMNGKDLEVFGDVHTVFPDGFVMDSEYLRYRPNERKIEIPNQYLVRGNGEEKDGSLTQFQSQGMDYAMTLAQIILPQAVRVNYQKKSDKGPTLIESDHAVIHRDKQVAFFTMYGSRPLESRFVHITQPTLFTQSRRAELRYGSSDKVLTYMVVYDDVLIRDTQAKTSEDESEEPSFRYATGGRGEFDTKTDIIRLTKFPQVYQDNDTVTGDVILLHRDTDLVEVEHSNAFSQGN